MPGVWGTVFQTAASIAEEVEREADLNPVVFGGKRKLKGSNSPEACDDVGAFQQPTKLAKFFHDNMLQSTGNIVEGNSTNQNEIIRVEMDEKDKTKNSSETQATNEKAPEQSPVDGEYPKLSLEERCARQICRKWLKNTYLEGCEPCDNSCGRIHEAPTNPQKLYKDYSFKGLPSKQQKRILAAIVAASK